MEFKIRANVIFSKDLTIEADNLKDAFDRAQEIAQGGFTRSELTLRDVNFELLSHAVGGAGLVEIEPRE